MAKGRSKKGKKAKWQLSLGLKETVFVAAGIIGLMMMSFALGTLTGRGDIYRVLHKWGLLSQAATKAVQPWAVPVSPPAPAPASPSTSKQAAAQVKTHHPDPRKGSIAAAPSATGAKKTLKQSPLPRERKSREEELRRMREEVAKKLRFQNSLDTGVYRATKSQKQIRSKSRQKTSSSLVRVARYRNKKAALAKAAELKKKGDNVTIKEGKDQKGRYFAVYRRVPASPSQTQTAAQNRPKRVETKLKTKRD